MLTTIRISFLLKERLPRERPAEVAPDEKALQELPPSGQHPLPELVQEAQKRGPLDQDPAPRQSLHREEGMVLALRQAFPRCLIKMLLWNIFHDQLFND